MRKYLKCYLTIGIIGMLVISATACGSQSSGTKDSEVTTEVTTEVITEEDEEESETAEVLKSQWADEDEQEMYSLYTDLNNSVLARVDLALNRYFSYVKEQEEFVRPGNIYSTHTISDSMKKDAESIKDMLDEKTELSALDSSYLELYPQLTALIDVINQIEEYTDLSAYLDDDYAKGAEYHQELWGLYGNYTELSAQVKAQYAEYSNTYLNKILAWAEAEDSEIHSAAVSALIAAKAIDVEFQAQGITDKNLPGANLETLQPLYDEFLSYVNIMLEQAKQPETIEAEDRWDDYLDSVKDAKTSMSLIIRNIKENKEGDILSSAGSGSIPSFRVGLKEMTRKCDRWLREERR